MTPVTWVSVCGNSSVFWDSDTTWNTDHPTFPECFQKTALIWISYGLLWLLLPLEIYVLINSRARSIPLTCLNLPKMLLNVCLIVLAVVEFSNALHINSQEQPMLSADIYNPVIKSLTFLLCVVLVHVERLQGIQSSGVLFSFWMTLALAESITFISLLEDAVGQESPMVEPHFVVHMFYFPLMLFQCVLACFGDAEPQYREVDDTQPNSCPKNRSTFISKLYFAWLNELLQLGARKLLKPKEVWNSSSEVLSHNTVYPFLRKWQHADNNQIVMPLWRVLSSIHRTQFLIATVLLLMSNIFAYCTPLILNLFIEFIAGAEPLWHGFLYAFTLFLTGLVASLCFWQATSVVTGIAIAVRSALVSAIYRKTLVLSNMSKHVKSMNQYIDMIDVDVSWLYKFLLLLPAYVTLPINLALGILILYWTLGLSSLIGMAFFLVLSLLTMFLNGNKKSLQTELLKMEVMRLKIIGDIVSGIKMVKLLAWEKAITSKTEKARERKLQNRSMHLDNGSYFIWTVAPYMVALVTLVAFVFIEKNNFLDPSKIFVTIIVLNILRWPMSNLSTLFADLIQTNVSVKCLTDFLSGDELDTSNVSHCTVSESVIISDGWFSWGKTENCILRNINFRVNKHRSVAVVGRQGIGKTSLLAAILGEMNKMYGAVNVHGNLAYASQNVWLLSATVKNNVLFGRKYNDDLYRKVIKACALDKEFDDDMMIGEGGAPLSVGQQQRVNLARVAYTQSDIYLLDDPLGALEARLAEFVFDNVLGPRGILKDKTRIIVMNEINFLHAVDEIIFVKDGTISESGSWNELQNYNSVALAEMIEEKEVLSTIARKPKEHEIAEKNCKRLQIPNQQTTTEEHTEDSKVELGRTFRSCCLYIRNVGICLCLVVCLCLPLAYVFYTSTYVWLSEWSWDYKRDANRNASLINIRLSMYAVLESAYGFCLLIGFLAIVDGGIKASSALHRSSLLAVVQSPLSFFDGKTSATIANRFSTNFILPGAFRTFLAVFLEMVSGLALICFYLPWVLVLVVILVMIVCVLQRYYIAAVDQLNRLSESARTSANTHLRQSYKGLATLRAYRHQNKFIRYFDNLLDDSLKYIYYRKAAFRWVGIRLDVAGNVVVLVTTLLGIYERNSLDSGTIAMLVTCSLSINYTFATLVKSSGALVSEILSMKKNDEFASSSEESTQLYGPIRAVDSQWPEFGTISLNHVCLKYRQDLDLAIRNLTCNIKAGEKIGIVGRSGSGKSTLVESLVRILEPTSGTILIDCIDISKVRLRDLRSRINFIPQETTIFTGTLRTNLDPLDENDDETLWKVLQQTNLASFVETLPEKLHWNLLLEEEHLSLEQRQLICIARALLRKSAAIVVLDEATSALDPDTEDLVMAAIKREFAKSTILIVSHRLTSIMDCDRVMVMENGLLKEFDTPKNLIANESSILKDLAISEHLSWFQENADKYST